MNKVFTYYEQLFPYRQDQALIALCAKTWGERGWQFECLSESLAYAHPLHKELMGRVSLFPTRNDPRYEASCYRRWLAFDLAVANTPDQRAVLTDYDVMNYCFYPTDLELKQHVDSFLHPETAAPPCCFSTGFIKAIIRHFIDVDSEAVEKQADRNGEPHISDMILLDYFTRNKIPRVPVCREVFEKGWRWARLVHYPSSMLADRTSLVKELRAS